MRSKVEKERKEAESNEEYAEEELKLRDQTLSKTAPDTDEPTKSLDTVEAPVEGRMEPIEEETRIEPPSGKDIDHEALELRDRTLADTAPDIDPKKKRIAQVTAPGQGGMQKT